MAEGGPQMPYPAGFPGQFPAGYPANFNMPQLGNQQAEQLKAFWQEQLIEVSGVPADPAVFKNHQLPLARIKKIMKSDEDVRMISAEAPVLFAKACEMFILELTLRSWMHAEENKRRTLQRNDVAAAITKTDIFDFLIDIVPREDLKEGESQAALASTPSTSTPAAPAAPLAPVPVAPRPQGPASHPALGPASLYFPQPFPMTAGALGGDPAQAAAAAAAAAAMMRPPIPGMGVDPALVSLYQQQFLSGQAWPHIPGLPPPPTAQSAAAAAAAVHAHQQQAAAAAVAAVAQAAQQQQAAAAAAAAGAAQAANASSGAQGHAQGQALQQTTSGAATSTGSQGPQNSGEQSGAGASEKKS